jgi:hypothetical protein
MEAERYKPEKSPVAKAIPSQHTKRYRDDGIVEEGAVVTHVLGT